MSRVHQQNEAYCRAWLDHLRVMGRSPKTLYQYGEKLEKLCSFLGDRDIVSADLSLLSAFTSRPRIRRGHGLPPMPATVARDVAVLRGLYRWMLGHGYLAKNPCELMEAPTVKNASPKAIDDGLWLKVWRSEFARDDERVVLGLGYFCGLRREEIAMLRPEQVDLGRGRLVGFKRKGDRDEKGDGQFPYLSAVTIFEERLPFLIGTKEAFLTPFYAMVTERRSSAFLLPWGEDAEPWRRTATRPGPPDGMTNPDQINRRLERLLKRLGLPEKAFTPHALRHSFVTKLLEAGIPLHVVSRLANHSDISITMKYVKTALDPLEEFLSDGPVNQWDRFGRGKRKV